MVPLDLADVFGLLLLFLFLIVTAIFGCLFFIFEINHQIKLRIAITLCWVMQFAALIFPYNKHNLPNHSSLGIASVCDSNDYQTMCSAPSSIYPKYTTHKEVVQSVISFLGAVGAFLNAGIVAYWRKMVHAHLPTVDIIGVTAYLLNVCIRIFYVVLFSRCRMCTCERWKQYPGADTIVLGLYAGAQALCTLIHMPQEQGAPANGQGAAAAANAQGAVGNDMPQEQGAPANGQGVAANGQGAAVAANAQGAVGNAENEGLEAPEDAAAGEQQQDLDAPEDAAEDAQDQQAPEDAVAGEQQQDQQAPEAAAGEQQQDLEAQQQKLHVPEEQPLPGNVWGRRPFWVFLFFTIVGLVLTKIFVF